MPAARRLPGHRRADRRRLRRRAGSRRCARRPRPGRCGCCWSAAKGFDLGSLKSRFEAAPQRPRARPRPQQGLAARGDRRRRQLPLPRGLPRVSRSSSRSRSSSSASTTRPTRSPGSPASCDTAVSPRRAGGGGRRPRGPLRRRRRSRSCGSGCRRAGAARGPRAEAAHRAAAPGKPTTATRPTVQRRRMRRATARVGGISSRTPKMSVMKPGAIRSAPPRMIEEAVGDLLAGHPSFGQRLVEAPPGARPSCFSSQEPTIASSSSRSRVGQTPISSPTWMIT